MKKKKEQDRLTKRYKVNPKGLDVALGEVRLQLSTLLAMLKRYEARHKLVSKQLV